MAARSPSILIIDDSQDILEVFRATLEAAGYQVSVAADGGEGLRAVQGSPPDLILTDISMPGMNGFDFLVHLRSDFAPPLPPVVVISGFEAVADEALRLGAVHFVAKPVEAAHLLEVVQQVLSGRAAGESSLLQEREFVSGVRARAVAAAHRLFAVLDSQSPTFRRALTPFVQRVADYFGFVKAAVVFTDGDGIRVEAATPDSSLRPGTALSGKLPFATGVLAGASALVITDSACRFGAALGADPRGIALGWKFLVAVPLHYEDVAIGSLCLFDDAPHPFEAEDLMILEGIGRGASRRLQLDFLVAEGLGLVSAALFDRMLGAELSLLHHQRGGLELLAVQMNPVEGFEDLATEIRKQLGTRAAVCQREPGTLAIYKRAADPAQGQRAASSALSSLSATGQVRASGWVSIVDDDLPQVSGDIVLRLVELALGESRGTRSGSVKRLKIGAVSPTIEVTPRPSPST